MPKDSTQNVDVDGIGENMFEFMASLLVLTVVLFIVYFPCPYGKWRIGKNFCSWSGKFMYYPYRKTLTPFYPEHRYSMPGPFNSEIVPSYWTPEEAVVAIRKHIEGEWLE